MTTLFLSPHYFWPVYAADDPLAGKDCSLPFEPATPLSRSQSLEGLFEQTHCALRALNLTLYFASGTSEIQENRQVLRARRRGPISPSKKQL